MPVVPLRVLARARALRHAQPWFPGYSGRGMKHNTIKALVCAQASLCWKMNWRSDAPSQNEQIQELLCDYEQRSPETHAEAFDMESDLKDMFDACFSMRGWSRFAQIKHWIWLLCALSWFGRACCMTTYCPLVESLELPSTRRGWDADGLPKYVDLAFLDWKWRSKLCKDQPYLVRLHRNYLDARFCPVTWLLIYLHYLKKEIKRSTGPLFADDRSGHVGKVLKPARFQTAMMKLFDKCFLFTCTSHSIRRSAFQWCGRCGGQESVAKLTARHTPASSEFYKYMEDGCKKREKAESENDEGWIDPIFKSWVWKPGVPNVQPHAQDFQGARKRGASGNHRRDR